MIELDDKLIKKFHQQKDGVYASAICVLIKVIFSSESRAKYWD